MLNYVTMKKISDEQLKQVLEAAIFVSDKPLSIEKMRNTILSDISVSVQQLNKALKNLKLDYANRGIHLERVASGYCFQSDSGLGQLLSRLWQETVPKYSRAMLETLALIAYKQPITRGEIEDIRGVAVSSNIIRSLTERDWIKVIGHKEVPGRPALFATTNVFLDYFSLSSLDELPSAADFAEHMQESIDDIGADTRVNSQNERDDAQGALNRNSSTNQNPEITGDNTLEPSNMDQKVRIH